MQAASKFTFDLNLSPEAQARPAIDADAHEAGMKLARDEGFQAGMDAGRISVEARSSEQLALSGEVIGAACGNLLQQADFGIENSDRQAIDLALLAARKLAPGLIAQQPMAELKALLRNCLADLQKTPHLAVRVNENHSEDLKVFLDKLAFEKGFEGRIIVLGEPDIAPGDGSIEWAEGGLTRAIGEIEQAIVESVAHFLGADGQDVAVAAPAELEVAEVSAPETTDTAQVQPMEMNSE